EPSHGEKLSVEDWKDILTACLRKARVVPGPWIGMEKGPQSHLRGEYPSSIIMSPNMLLACPSATRFVGRAKNTCCVKPRAPSSPQKCTIAKSTLSSRRRPAAAMMRFALNVSTSTAHFRPLSEA